MIEVNDKKFVVGKIVACFLVGLIVGALLVGVVSVSADEGTTSFEDDFSELNLNNWIISGSPSPRVLASVEGRTGVFDNNGDSWCDSNAVSKDTFSFPKGFTMESDVYVSVTNMAGCWDTAAIAVTRNDATPYEPSDCPGEYYYNFGVRFRLYYAGDACWCTPPELRRHAYFDLGLYTEDESGEGENHINADDYINGWHNLKIVVGEDRFVSFYCDDDLIYTSEKRIHEDALQNERIYLGERSSGSAGKVYHDYIKVYGGEEEPSEQPTAEFTAAPTEGTAPLTVQFTDTSTGNPTTWEWDVDGDGNVDYASQYAVHTYTEPDIYTVSLTVSNEYGSNIGIKNDYITVKQGRISLAIGGDLTIGGKITLSGENTLSDTTYLFLTGPNLPENGVRLDDLSVNAVSGDSSTFVSTNVNTYDTWYYEWDTFTISGGIPYPGTYTIYAVSEPKNKEDLFPSTGVSIPFSLGLPSKFDWRDWRGVDWMTSAKDQGRSGACAYFALIGSIEAKYNIEQGEKVDIDLSEYDLWYNVPREWASWAGLFDYVKTTGIVDEDCWPHYWNLPDIDLIQPDRRSDYSNRLWKIKDWTTTFEVLGDPDYLNIELIKCYLIYNGPQVIVLPIPENGHAVVLTGWDDGEIFSDGKGGWIIKNSWGTGWSDGFGVVSYNFWLSESNWRINRWSEGVTPPEVMNPSWVYCDALGYEYIIDSTENGDRGYCKLPDGRMVDAWEFLLGEEGQEYSYCALKGYEMKKVIDDELASKFLLEHCAVCVLEDGNEVEVTELMGLSFDWNSIIPAEIRIEPETLNLASKGVFTAFILLPEGYNVSDINISSVECECASAIEGVIVHGGEGGHHGKGHIGDTLKVKFNRQDLVNVPTGDAVTLTVTGELTDGTPFEGSDVIRVIDQG